MEEILAVSLLRNAAQLRDTERLTGSRCHFGALAAIRSDRWMEERKGVSAFSKRASVHYES
jgi:hypothetical protein